VHVGGRGGAFMQVEMKDIEQGTKTNQRFRTEDKVERAFVDARDMQYLYQDGESYFFMEQENNDQINLSAEFLESQSGYLMPEMKVQVNFYNGRPIGIQLPPSVILTVTDTEPGIKNSTATNSFKPAKMETGVTVQVPPFISTGDKIKVDTNEGKYMERA
jgi:elongation factor P